MFSHCFVSPIFFLFFVHVTWPGGRPPVLVHDNVTFSSSSTVILLGVTVTVGFAEIYTGYFIINRFFINKWFLFARNCRKDMSR